MEKSCNDCSAHGRLDQRVSTMEKRVEDLYEDKKNKDRSAWQVIASIGLSFLSVGISLFVTLISGGHK